jgi:hypothetical protein
VQAATLAVLALFDGHLHRLGVDVEAEPPMAVDHGRGRRFLHDGPFGAGHDVAGLDAVDIGRDRDHAVGVMAGQIGVDAAGGDGVGLLLRCAGAPKQRGADTRETVGLDDRHGNFLALRPHEARVLLAVIGVMLSKRGWPSKAGKSGRPYRQQGAPADVFTERNGRGRDAEFWPPAGVNRAAIRMFRPAASAWHTRVRNIPGNRPPRSSAVYSVAQLAGYTNHHLGLLRAMFRASLKGLARGLQGTCSRPSGVHSRR